MSLQVTSDSLSSMIAAYKILPQIIPFNSHKNRKEDLAVLLFTGGEPGSPNDDDLLLVPPVSQLLAWCSSFLGCSPDLLVLLCWCDAQSQINASGQKVIPGPGTSKYTFVLYPVDPDQQDREFGGCDQRGTGFRGSRALGNDMIQDTAESGGQGGQV